MQGSRAGKKRGEEEEGKSYFTIIHFLKFDHILTGIRMSQNSEQPNSKTKRKRNTRAYPR